MPMLRPWLAAVALIVCITAAFALDVWRAGFHAPTVVGRLADAATLLRLNAIGMSLHHRAAELHRAEVRRMREAGESPQRIQAARFALADELRAAALLAEAGGVNERAVQWLADATQAAPERVDLLCDLTASRTRDSDPDERRLQLLRLSLAHDAPCANLLVAESFLEADDVEAAYGYLKRAAEAAPAWPKPHLALARLHLAAGSTDDARTRAQQALDHATDLRSRLDAAAIVRRAGGSAPQAWQITAEWLWHSYSRALPFVGAFVLLLISPAIISAGRRGVAWARAQRTAAESAS
jgi:tetratricopeptide (TPR) repeat protein